MSRKEKLNRLAVDFQPDAVEIAMRPLPLWAKLGVTCGVLFFLGALVASYFCKVDVVVEGTGKLVSEKQNIVMKPLDRTVIKSINVSVGDVVKEGEVLMTFDPAINRAEEERLRSEVESIDAQYERWLCEAEKRNYKVPVKSNVSQRDQLRIFKQRQDYYQQKLRSYDESINRVKVNIDMTKSAIKRQQERLRDMLEISRMYEGLNRKGSVSRQQLLEIRMSLNQLKADIEKLEKSIPEMEHEIKSSEASKETFIQEWFKDITENLVQARQSRMSTHKALEKVLQLNEYVELRAPCDAIVHEIANFPVGSAVREAEALITLVPINCDILLEAEIPAKDIGRIKVGDSVRVKLPAFPFQKHGTLDGRIATISEDTFQKQVGNPEQGQSVTYYRARIVLSGKLKNLHDNFRLIPGMEAQAEIKVGTRSVLEYVIHPLVKSLDEAIREP